jgi:NTE family protein
MDVVEEMGSEYHALLSAIPLFASLSSGDLKAILAGCERRQVEAGAWCVRQGDPSDGLYVVICGRLETFVGEDRRGEISRGQVFGEISVLTGQPRAAGVRAVRDSELLVLPAATYDKLPESHPSLVHHMAQIVIGRLLAPETSRSTGEQVLTIGIFPAGDRALLADITVELYRTLAARSPTMLVRADDAPEPEAWASWGHQLESQNRYVLYQSSPGSPAWHRWCLRQSDRVVLVADVEARPPAAPPVLAADIAKPAQRASASLLLVHPAARPMESGAEPWLRAMPAVRHLHVQRGRSGDMERAARLLVDRGCGLVLGGGGPRGLAHLGVMQALEEAGVPIDAIGGTSIGALIGAMRALHLDARTCQERVVAGLATSGALFRPTVPVLSLSSARTIRRILEDPSLFGNQVIEACWLPYFSVSANLTRAEVVVHDHGPLAAAVRASLSLPGILPPVRSGDDLLVDGGVMNNLPVDVMRAFPGVGTVVAVDVGVGVEMGAPRGYQETPSGWTLLLERLVRGRTAVRTPTALEILFRAKDLAALRNQRDVLAACSPDLLVRPPVAASSMFDFTGSLHLIEEAYHHTLDQLDAGGWGDRDW